MATDRGKAFLDDNESLRAIVDGLPAHLSREYWEMGALSKEALFPNRVMVLYTLRGGKPDAIELLKFGDITVTRIQGPVVEVFSNRPPVEISVTPAKWFDRDLFMHVPQHFEFKWTGKRTPEGRVQFAPNYAMLFKTRSREHMQVEGHTYCVTLNKFRERFPGVDIRY